MFERFTERARHVVVLAQEEAKMLRHDYIGTEHLLLGLIHEGEGIGARALEAMDISLESARRRTEEIIGVGAEPPKGHMPFTPRAKKVLELSLREALQLGHNYIGTEHILLGLIREGEGVAAQVLQKLGADLDSVRQTVIELLSGYESGETTRRRGTARMEEPASEVGPDVPTEVVEDFPTCPSCRSPLSEAMAVRVLDVMVEDETTPVKVAYCRSCGVALGVMPD